MTRSYLLVLADREAIAWVLREQRMAFPATPRAEVRTLAPGDRLFLYTTRGAWNNPTRDRSRIIGTARVRTAVQALEQPIEIGGRSFWSQCDLTIDRIAPYRSGLEIQPLVPRLAAFPKPEVWSIYLRRPLLELPEPDTALLDAELAPLVTTRKSALPTYPTAKPVTAR